MSQQPGFRQLLSIADVAQMLACSEANVYALIEAGHLPYVPIGKTKGYRIDPKDLEEFIEARKIKKRGAPAPALKPARPQLKHIRL